MKCTEAHFALLEADLPTLEGLTDGPLSLHIRSCSACRSRAEAILRGEALLASGLTQELALPDLDRVIHEALQKEERVVPLTGRLRHRVFRGPGVALLPLAAAAAMAALFLSRSPSLPGPVFSPTTQQAGLEVAVPEGQSVAVLETSNPDITVLWLF